MTRVLADKMAIYRVTHSSSILHKMKPRLLSRGLMGRSCWIRLSAWTMHL